MAKKLQDMLIEERMVTEGQLADALSEVAKSGQHLGTILVRLGYLNEEALAYFLAMQHGAEYVELEGEIAKDILKSVSKEIAGRYQVLPIKRDAKALTVVCADPGDDALFRLREDLLLDSKIDLIFSVATESALREALNRNYGIAPSGSAPGNAAVRAQDSSQDIVMATATLNPEMLVDPSESGSSGSSGGLDQEYDENAVNDAPVIRLVNSIISQAVAKRASDIHLNPFEKNMVVRYRIDGTLQTQADTPPKYRRAMVARIKVMARMDIVEKRKAQDGRIKIKVQGKVIDLRVSCLPNIYGENIVMRILDQESLQLDMNKLGFEPAEMAKYVDAISQPYGMVLHTGPTGSGKTTTLYSALSQLNKPHRNIMTIEDPVEYQLPGVVQVQVNPDADLTFATVLRSLLRQDPNVLMVGEIRDSETAEIAIKAALTGHLLFSTLHTNDAPSTVMRLVDMGIDPIYVGSSVLIVVAQRLVKRICANCKEPFVPMQEDLERALIAPASVEGLTFSRGAGCTACNGSGYKGRIALYEIMRITPAISDLIFRRGDLNELTALARSEGMMTLRELAIKKWKDGTTTLDEVLRVTAAE
jgi:type IV pilus assembly protein PilB